MVAVASGTCVPAGDSRTMDVTQACHPTIPTGTNASGVRSRIPMHHFTVGLTRTGLSRSQIVPSPSPWARMSPKKKHRDQVTSMPTLLLVIYHWQKYYGSKRPQKVPSSASRLSNFRNMGYLTTPAVRKSTWSLSHAVVTRSHTKATVNMRKYIVDQIAQERYASSL